MKILDSEVLSSMQEIIEMLYRKNAKHEHTTIHIYENLDKDILNYEQLGFKLLFKNEKIAFIEKDNCLGIELAPTNVPLHEAWIVPYKQDWSEIVTELYNNDNLPIYEGSIVENGDKCSIMYEHSSGCYLQIVWRKDQIFTDMF